MTLTGRVTAASLAVLFACLVVVGVGVAGVLQVRAVRSLDQALLAAAFAEAHPWQEERFASDHARSPVSVRPWRDGDPRVPKVLYDQAVGQDLPRWHLLDGYRVLLLVVAPEGSGGQQLVVVAEAPEVTTWEAVGPFAVAYTVVAGMALLLAAVAVRWAMVRALQPLSDASEAIGRVRQLGSHERLASSGAAEVDRLIGSTNALLERLERAYRAQSSFTAQAAHELRTPVTVLKGELELALRRERDAADYRSTLERATGERMLGWAGQDMGESERTPRLEVDDPLRAKLGDMPYTLWGQHIDAIIRQENRRIADQAWRLYQQGIIERSELSEAGRPLGTMSHLLRVYLIDAQKRIRNIYSVSFLHADTLANDVRTLLMETDVN